MENEFWQQNSFLVKTTQNNIFNRIYIERQGKNVGESIWHRIVNTRNTFIELLPGFYLLYRGRSFTARACLPNFCRTEDNGYIITTSFCFIIVCSLKLLLFLSSVAELRSWKAADSQVFLFPTPSRRWFLAPCYSTFSPTVLCLWHINITFTLLDIINFPVSYAVYDVSETEFNRRLLEKR